MRGFTRQFHKAHKSLIFLKSELVVQTFMHDVRFVRIFRFRSLTTKNIFFKARPFLKKMDSTVEVGKLNSHNGISWLHFLSLKHQMCQVIWGLGNGMTCCRKHISFKF